MRTPSGDVAVDSGRREVDERDSDGQPTRAGGSSLANTDERCRDRRIANGDFLLDKRKRQQENEPDWQQTHQYRWNNEERCVPRTDERSRGHPVQDADSREDMLARGRQQGRTGTGRLRLPDGHGRFQRRTGRPNRRRPVIDGAITHYLGYLIDITDRKRLEQSLRQSEQSLREMTEVASDTDRGFEGKLAAPRRAVCDQLRMVFALTDDNGEIARGCGVGSPCRATRRSASAPMRRHAERTIEQVDIPDEHRTRSNRTDRRRRVLNVGCTAMSAGNDRPRRTLWDTLRC